VAAGAVALPALGCGAERSSPGAAERAAPGDSAVLPGGLSVRMASSSQRTLLARRRIAVRVKASHAGRLQIGVQAVEHVPGRRPGPLLWLTAQRLMHVPAGRPVTAQLTLTGSGAHALATCARHRLRLALRWRGRQTVAGAGAERLDSARCSRPFSPTSFWNTPVPEDAPLDPASDALVAALGAQVDDAASRHYGPTVNTINYSTPVEEVPANQPRVRVILDDPATYRRAVRRALRAVPLPPDARPAGGTDRHLVVWQPATDTLWEFWKLRREAGTWHARAAGRIRHVSTSAGVFPATAGATATSLPLLGGLIRPEELERGTIDHVLALAIPRPRAGVWTAPARRTDGFVRETDALPEGAHLRLDPRLDLNALQLPRPLLILARAAQRYGMVIRDTAGTVALYAEAPSAARPISYRRLLPAGPTWQALAQFPWRHLQVLQMHLTTYRGAAGS
jgi:hypothetical protein